MTTRRIVFLQTASFFGSTENYLLDILAALDRGVYSPRVIAPDSVSLAPFFDRLEGLGIPWQTFPEGGSGAPMIRAIMRAIRQDPPDLVHVADMAPAAIVAARLVTRRVVVTFHTPELTPRFNARGALMMRASVVAPRVTLFTSPIDLETGVRRWAVPRGRARVVPLGIDTEKFHPRRRARDPGPASPVVLGTIARISPQKDPLALVEVFDRVSHKCDRPVHLRWLGDGPLRTQVEDALRARKLTDKVEIVSHTEDVAGFLGGLDVFLMTSSFEGLCYAVLEAMATGIPVVATRVGGIRHSVIEGETGFLSDSGDVEGLARATLRVLEDPSLAARFSAQARERAVEHFSLSSMTQGTFDAYDQIMRG